MAPRALPQGSGIVTGARLSRVPGAPADAPSWDTRPVGQRNPKENCEHDRAFDTRNAITASRTMDEHSENIVRSQAKAAEFTSQIAEKEELLKKVEQQLAETTEQRNKETAEYFASKKDDEEAAALIEEAIQTIESFYAANGLMLAQHGKQATFESVAGKALLWGGMDNAIVLGWRSCVSRKHPTIVL